MSKPDMRGVRSYTNHHVTDEVGRRYRVTLSSNDKVLFVGRKCLKSNREAVLDPWGKKGTMLADKARAQKAEEKA